MDNLIYNYNLIENTIINDINNINIINQYVKKIYIINLNTDKVRAKYIEILMKKLNINYSLIHVQKLKQNIFNQVLKYSKPCEKKMTIGEAGCYLSHMWCLHDISKNNYNNAIILEDDIIAHKQINFLFESIVIKKEYDYLLLGAADHGFNKGNSDLIKDNIYIPKNHVILGTHAIYYSNYGAKTIFNDRLKYPVYFDKNFIGLFNFFDDDKTGVCYPNLFTVENSTSNINHNFGITKYKYNDYYYNTCYKDFNFNDYHFIYLDLFLKFILEAREKKNILFLEELLKCLLMNYFNNDNELTEFHYNKLDTDFFTIEDYKNLITVCEDKYISLYYKDYKDYCNKNKITSGILLRNKIKMPTWNNINNPSNLSDLSILFHKQHLDISLQNKNIDYNVIKKISFIQKYVAHLHCFNIDNFEHIYGKYLKVISENMDIIITYCCGNNIPDIYTIIQIENKGMDIGAKIIAIDYLKNYNIHNKSNVHNYILFLHSKSCNFTREIYFNSLLNNLTYILKRSEEETIGGFFPPTIHMGDDYPIIYNQKYLANGLLQKCLYTQPVSNKLYLNELINYFELSNNNITLFPSGNCYFLHINIANKLFGDKQLYNCLNNKDCLNNLVSCFDYNWVKIYYNIRFDEIEFIYEAYKQFNLNGNYLQLQDKNKKYADGMVEHIFERIIFQIIISKNMTIDILPNGKNEEQIKNLSKEINKCYK